MKVAIYSGRAMGRTGMERLAYELRKGLNKFNVRADNFYTYIQRGGFSFDATKFDIKKEDPKDVFSDYDLLHVLNFSWIDRDKLPLFENLFNLDIPKTVWLPTKKELKISLLSKTLQRFDKIFVQRDMSLLHNYTKIPLPVNLSDKNLFVEEKKNRVSSGIRISFIKGFRTIFEAVSSIESEDIRFYGDNPAAPILLKMFKEIKDEIKIVGPYDHPVEVFKKAKVSVGSHSEKYPGLEYTQIDAIKYGCVPVVFGNTSPVSSVPSVRYNDYNELAKVINELLNDEDKRISMARKNLTFLEKNHSYRKVIPEYVKEWERS